MDNFEKMVETLEEVEDTVECKECFDLFPKAECEKHEMGGYICPTCKGAMKKDFIPDSRDISFDLYDHDFPEVADYDDSFKSVPKTERDLSSAFDALVKDEYEAIGAYDAVADVVDETVFDDAKQKKATMKALKHIRDEEEEHIDELRDIAKGDAEKVDDEDLDELFSGATSKPGGNSAVAPMLASAEGEVEDEAAEPLKESATKWVCWYNGKDIGTVEADTEEAAIEKMMIEYPRHYNNEDFYVEPAIEEAKESETLVEGPLGKALGKLAKAAGKKVKGIFGKDHGKNLAPLFNEGYVIYCQMPSGVAVPEQHGARFDTYDDAIEAAQVLSKTYKGSAIWVYAVYPVAADFGQATKQIIGNKTSVTFGNKKVDVVKTVVAKFRNGSAVVDNSADFDKKFQAAVEADGVLAKSSNTVDPVDPTEQSTDTDAEDDKDLGGDPTAQAEEDDKNDGDVSADTEVESEVAAADADDTADTTDTTADETPAEEAPARGSKEDNSKFHGHKVSNKSIGAFRKLMRSMGLEVYDAFGKKVGTDIPSLQKITAETLLDYEMMVNGKKVPVAKWIQDMVKNGIMVEGLAKDLIGEALYESYDDSYDTFGDFEDEFEDEDIVVCAWCGQDFPREECRLERDMGYLCQFCEEAIKSRGEELIFVD